MPRPWSKKACQFRSIATENLHTWRGATRSTHRRRGSSPSDASDTTSIYCSLLSLFFNTRFLFFLCPLFLFLFQTFLFASSSKDSFLFLSARLLLSFYTFILQYSLVLRDVSVFDGRCTTRTIRTHLFSSLPLFIEYQSSKILRFRENTDVFIQ